MGGQFLKWYFLNHLGDVLAPYHISPLLSTLKTLNWVSLIYLMLSRKCFKLCGYLSTLWVSRLNPDFSLLRVHDYLELKYHHYFEYTHPHLLHLHHFHKFNHLLPLQSLNANCYLPFGREKDFFFYFKTEPSQSLYIICVTDVIHVFFTWSSEMPT